MLASLREAIPQWLLITIIVLYVVVLLYTIYRIIMDTQSVAKTLGYLLLLIILPLIGILIYFSFGVDTRHGRTNQKLGEQYRLVSKDFREYLIDPSESNANEIPKELGHYTELAQLVQALGMERLTHNTFELLQNGEEKFPEVLKCLEGAKHYINMEYYAWENDVRGNQIKEVLIRKAKEGVAVRVLYDDFASMGIRKNIAVELSEAGVQVHPIIKVKILKLANRLNHRDHRKIIIIDGILGFVGGINISDRYDNSIDTGLYWRDTHMKIMGPGVMNLQRHFAVNWTYCQPDHVVLQDVQESTIEGAGASAVEGLSQILAGGPYYKQPSIMLTYSRLFTLAEEKLYIANPYFIPNDTIMDALKTAALSGVDVRLMVPYKSDSALVGAAARFYFQELLRTGVKIHLYKKGFLHAKTVVADGLTSIVGTANMDIRSFDLNFEVMSIVYCKKFAAKMEKAFLEDLKDSVQLDLDEWMAQSRLAFFKYAVARLVSSLL